MVDVQQSLAVVVFRLVVADPTADQKLKVQFTKHTAVTLPNHYGLIVLHCCTFTL